jgi:signal transduction histidine kinase
MRKLYLRIYLAVLASLAAFALASGFIWRQVGNTGPGEHAFEVAGALAQAVLPPASAPGAEQQAALARLTAAVEVDLALFGPDRKLLAAVGTPLPAPAPGHERGRWWRPWRAPPAPGWVVHLPDGRLLVSHFPHGRRPPRPPVLLSLALIALAVGVGAYPVVRRLTRRLERLQTGVESLGAGDLGARVPVEGDDEVARLARSFNHAAARIEALVAAHRSLLANASHELRTPLARIRMTVELMKQGADPRRKQDLERDIAELDALIDEILLASRLDTVTERDANEEVDLLALASEECSRYDEAELDGQPVTVHGDGRLLRRMIRNLLENARRHGRPPIEVHVRGAAGTAEISVSDRGPGVPETERESVFEPFHRSPGAGERAGAGLGLTLVRQIARRHGGDARYLPQEPSGSCFVVTIAALPHRTPV